MAENYIGKAPGGIDTALIGLPNGIAGLDAAAKLLSANFRQLKGVQFTRDMTLASGNQAVVGAGFKPRAVFFFATSNPGNAVGQTSVGMASDGAPIAQAVFSLASNVSPGNFVSQFTGCILLFETASISFLGALASFDADGFTITWTRTGVKTGTVSVQAFCIP